MPKDYEKSSRVRSINPLQDEIEKSKGGGGIARYLLGKNVGSKDLTKLGKADMLRETLKSRSKKYDKNASSFSPSVKKRKQAIEDLDKYMGSIESKYVTKQAKGGLVRVKPKLAQRGWK